MNSNANLLLLCSRKNAAVDANHARSTVCSNFRCKTRMCEQCFKELAGSGESDDQSTSIGDDGTLKIDDDDQSKGVADEEEMRLVTGKRPRGPHPTTDPVTHDKAAI
jgi:hypothetical protein